MISRVLYKSQSVEWPTPDALAAKLSEEFGGFTLDPCPYGGDEDGLSTLFCPWAGHRVFINPPYGRKLWFWINRWNEPDLALYLLPVRTDVRWFHDIVLKHASEIRFIRGRLKFGGAAAPAPFPSMIVVFRNKPYEPNTPSSND